MPVDLDDLKRDLRPIAKQQRAAAAAAAPDAATQVLLQLLAALERGAIPLAPDAAVSAYWPKGDELDPRPLATALAVRGHAIGLPVVVEKRAPLLFRRWQASDSLVEAPFGLSEPAADQPEVVPALLLVPLLAFDRKGWRLGYGGGFYDRTLTKLRDGGGQPYAIGIAYSGQELPEVPHGPNDRPLQGIVTEKAFIPTSEHDHAPAVLR